jgi:hypothetical protein
MSRFCYSDSRLALTTKQAARGPVGQVPVEENMLVSEERTKELLAIDEVLTRLQERDARVEEIGNCRFFEGLTVVQAESLSFSSASAMRVGCRSRVAFGATEANEPPTTGTG